MNTKQDPLPSFKMFTVSNGLSALRLPLAFLFLSHSIFLRLTAVIAAMISDSIDGYFARKFNSASKFGALLDPAMDKLFVYFALTVLYFEGSIPLNAVAAMLSRDLGLIIYGLYISLTGNWAKIEFRPIRWGKITTAMQFLVLIALVLSYPLNWYVYAFFILFGIMALLELFYRTFTRPA